MEPLRELSQLNKLTSPFLRRNVMTNCFLPAGEFVRYMEKEAAFFTAGDDALVILLKKTDHDLIYYYIKEGGRPPAIGLSRPTVLEIVRRDERQAQAAELWQQAGFRLAVTRERMECTALHPTPVAEQGVFAAGEERAGEIMDLLCAGFDHLTGCIPEKEELTGCLARREILCIEENGRIEALVHFRNEKAVSEIRHLLVAAGSRGRGLAGRVVNRYKTQLIGTSFKLRLWVKEDNLTARTFYEKNGYRCDGLKADVLIAANNI
ncbi:MAG: GNAT family N-acetyltransferase [Deltaproteobacteria bacterium]